MNGVEQEAVRAHVARITASDLFAGAGRLCRFLLFTVESKLDGRESDVKEYVLGREVFDRGNDYDTRLDPIVRVEARRLRARLAEYYSGPGRDEPLRLEYPKGSYVPVFSSVAATRARGLRPSRVWVVVAALALVVLFAAGGVYWLMRAQPVALIAPIPGRWIDPKMERWMPTSRWLRTWMRSLRIGRLVSSLGRNSCGTATCAVRRCAMSLPRSVRPSCWL